MIADIADHLGTIPEAVLWSGAASLGLLLALFYLLLRRSRRPEVILDGSNVMHWREDGPSLDTVREVIASLEASGFKPGVVFDANAGYLLSGRYRHHDSFAKALGLPADRVMVVPKGTPADPLILQVARDRGARIVSNDRFRDWAERFPEVAERGHIIRGRYDKGSLRFQTGPR